jgi:putative FmdB family regulatory protein
MPIYEYRCIRCNNLFEVMQKITEDPLTECITCNGPVKKLISNTSFQLKGSGWYTTDYVKKSGNNGADTEKAKDQETAKDTSTSSEGATKGEEAVSG